MCPTAKVDATPSLRALKRALMFERKARCTDFRGQHSTFSKFMEKSADELCRAQPLDARWSTLKGLFRNYSSLDLSTRINVLHRAEEIIDEASEAALPKTGTAASDKPGTQDSKKGNDPDRNKQITHRVDEKKPEARLYKSLDEIPIQYVKGVGPKVAELFHHLEINTAEDLLRHYPRRHLDFQNRLMIKQLRAGVEATVFGTIRSVGAFQSRAGNVSILTINIGDGTGTVCVTRFIGGRSNKYLLERCRSQYPKNSPVIVSGTVEIDRYKHRLQMKNAEIEVLGTPDNYDCSDDPSSEHFDSLHTGRLVPVYRLTDGLSLRQLRQIIHNTIAEFSYLLEDPVPQNVREEYFLCDLQTAVREIHFPTDLKSKEEAQHRLVFDELFMMQLRLAQRRYLADKEESGLALNLQAGDLVDRFCKLLPFTLTQAQERVFREIASDLSSDRPMQRLVQGDVGSGKTVVAIMSMLVAIQNGYQCAMMAPTEILAEQHYREMQKYLPSLGLKAALLLGKQGTKERKYVYRELLNGQVHVAVGTHALIQEDVEFHKLGLVIIDEQHRFGVKQRAKLRSKGTNPQLLTMTATPIPRTLALSVHGDLDISEIDELPPGRKPIKTELFSAIHKRQIWAFIDQEVKKGRQAYIVFPLIDESETLSAKAATAEYEKLASNIFAGLRVGLMHGRLKNEDKEEVMERFRSGKLDILVCTTVIEVGVDVSNATIMVIENADRFGLSQLHQLRGRVGRGAEQSYCFLVADLKAETTRQRLEIMTQTTDGFVVAQKDLELRGPGEFLGTRQSGLSDLFLADIVRDAKILEDARHAAIDLMKEDPSLHRYPELARRIQDKESGAVSDLMGSG